jgi:hypothetical protein
MALACRVEEPSTASKAEVRPPHSNTSSARSKSDERHQRAELLRGGEIEDGLEGRDLLDQ